MGKATGILKCYNYVVMAWHKVDVLWFPFSVSIVSAMQICVWTSKCYVPEWVDYNVWMW